MSCKEKMIHDASRSPLGRALAARLSRRAAVCGAALLVLAPVAARAAVDQGAAVQPVITEKLGATIPAGLQLNDESGRPVFFRQLIDRPTVITFNFFRCGGICTPQLNNLVHTINDSSAEPGVDYQVITVSFDPADTPEVAARKRENYLKTISRPFPPSAWRFLTGDAATTKTLADSVGFGFDKRGDTYIHPGALIIVSPEAKVTRYLYGITYLPAELQMAVADAKKGLAQPSTSRALSFCYSYDPASRRLVFNATRLAGILSLVFAGGVALIVLRKGRPRGGNREGSAQ